MAIDVSWDRKSRIRLEFVGRWDWEALHTAGQAAHRLAREASSAVDLILDLSACGLLSTSAWLTDDQDYPSPIPGNCDTVMIVGDVTAQATIALLCRAYPELRRRYHTASTLTEAHLLLNGRARKRPLTRRLAAANGA